MYRSHLEDMDSYESEDEGSCVPMFFEVKDIQSMREGPSTIFQTIVQNFYPYSCGRREYKRRLLSECISRIASTSDEAMILVVLENNYEYWCQIGREIHGGGGDMGKRKMTSWPIQPKWTHSRNNNNMEWTKEGRACFVEIVQLVAKQRKSEMGKEMEKEMLDWLRSDTMIPRKEKRKREEDDDSVCVPVKVTMSCR
jgi:hypothetical protein